MSICVFLRVPPLFIIDEIIKISFGIQDLGIINTLNTLVNNTPSQTEIRNSIQYNEPNILLFIKIIISCLIFCSSLCVFVLPTRYLYRVYLYVAPICVVLFSYWANMQILTVLSEKYVSFKSDMINEVIARDDIGVIIYHFALLQIIHFLYLFCNIILQFCLSQLFDYLQAYTTNHSIHKVVCFSFIFPTLIALIPGMHAILKTVTLLSTLLPLFIILKTLWLNIFTIINIICSGYNHTRESLNNYEIFTFVLIEWLRLEITKVLLMFWGIRVLVQTTYMLINKEIQIETWYEAMKYLLVRGCDTLPAVLGMASFVSYLCHCIDIIFQSALSTEEQVHIGNMSAFLFFVLAWQNNLTTIEPEERIIKLYQNICFIFDSILYCIHSLVDPLLISFSITQNNSFNRHFRALLVCVFLIIFPLDMMAFLWSNHLLDRWLFFFYVYNIQIIVKVLVTLTVYSLHMINGYRKSIWENLDDYLFYILSFGNVMCFCVGISTLMNGVYEMFFESGNITHAPFLCLHAYLVLWRSPKNGWRVLNRRRKVTRKIKSLADATSAQLSEFEDICSICRYEMVSAKITNCNHYFHRICLHKWLHLNDNCPMCHNIL